MAPHRNNADRRRSGPGFTLVELLVVVAILVLLLAISLPVLGMVRERAKVAASQATINTISTGLDLYYNDLNVYPESFWDAVKVDSSPDEQWWGAQVLVQAMIGYLDAAPQPTDNDRAPNDGATGPGFRTMFRGDVYGPYVEPDKIRTLSVTTYDGDAARPVFIDAFDQPILYYRYGQAADGVDVHRGYDLDMVISPSSGYPDNPNKLHAEDGWVFDDRVQVLGQDWNINEYASRASGSTNTADEDPYDYYRTDYILMSPGPDEQWTPLREDEESDDITNLRN